MRALIAAVVAGIVAATASAAVHHPPAKDSFSGSMSSTSGRFSTRHGQVAVELRFSSAGAWRRMTMTFRRVACTKKRRCLQLVGQLQGMLTPPSGHSLPDIGATYDFNVSGKLHPIGEATAKGTIHGTGFIRRGYESMVMTISAKGGTVKIDARSKLVPGFTSP